MYTSDNRSDVRRCVRISAIDHFPSKGCALSCSSLNVEISDNNFALSDSIRTKTRWNFVFINEMLKRFPLYANGCALLVFDLEATSDCLCTSLHVAKSIAFHL